MLLSSNDLVVTLYILLKIVKFYYVALHTFIYLALGQGLRVFRIIRFSDVLETILCLTAILYT
jgi:hypothetical protein